MTKTVIKQATTIEEQIERLKERGMIIRSNEFAKMYLWNIGYYRLGFYWFPYEQDYPQKVNRNHLFNEGTDFSTIMTLYDFDSTLRSMLSAALLKIEVDIRAKVIYLISNLHKQSPAWFADSRVVSRDFIEDFTEKYNREIINNEVIRNHARYHINDRFAPAWKRWSSYLLATSRDLSQA
jgi:abortive infection bacteriophage resistance protein